MNTRRWVALAIAVGLLLFSGITASLGDQKKDDSEKTLTGLNAMLYGTNQIEKNVIEDGDSTQQIVKLTVDGTISDSGGGGIFSNGTYNHQDFLAQLQAIQDDVNIKAVLLEVNSPGGGVYESAEIAKEMKKIHGDKPIYVSMKNTAASGGYYISAEADKIFAAEDTLTGSIGVIMSGLNYSGLFEKLGISDQTYKSGALKDLGSANRPATDEDKKVLQQYVDSAYDRFIKVVVEGREMTEEAVRKLADGRIYDGKQAQKIGLVDELGYEEDTLKALRKDHDLENAQLISYRISDTGFASSWLGLKLAQLQGFAPSEESKVLHIFESLGTAEASKPLYYYGGD